MILGLCGAAGAGKDTAADHLTANYGYQRRAFAEPMRSALAALDPMVTAHGNHYRLSHILEHLGWDTAKREIPDVRRLLQRFGTEVGRNQWGDDFWVQRATHDLTGDEAIVFTDVRFANEAAAVHRLGGRLVRLERPGAGLTGDQAAHPSEVIDFDIDLTITNDGTVDDLHRLLDRTLLRFGVPVGA